MNSLQSKSDQILCELSRRSQPMPAARIATAISHDLGKTRALIQFMIRSKKIAAQGPDASGTQTYGLTSLGRELVGKLEGIGQYVHNAAPPSSTPTDDYKPKRQPSLPVGPTREGKAKAAPEAGPMANRAPRPAIELVAEPPPDASIEHQMLEYFKGQTEAACWPGSPDTASPSPVGTYQTASLQPSRHAITPPYLRARFGVLNSGELVIIAPGGSMIMLAQDQLPELQKTLGGLS